MNSNDFVQDIGNPNVLAMELPQSCSKPGSQEKHIKSQRNVWHLLSPTDMFLFISW